MNETNNRRSIASRVILVTVSLALLGGLAVQFTPGLFGSTINNVKTNEKTIFTVNKRPVTQKEFDRIKGSNQLFSLNLGGLAQQEIDTLAFRQMIMFASVYNDVSRTKIPDDEMKKAIDNFRVQNNIKDDAQYASLLAANNITDAELRKSLREQAAVQKRIKELQDTAKVNDDQMRFYFEINKANFKNEAKVKARQIVFTDQKKADSVLAKAKNGEDFAKLARENSTDKTLAEQDGALGAKAKEKTPQPVGRAVFPVAVADAAFKLKAGETTDVISDGGKFYIVKVEEVFPEGPQTFEQAKDRIKSETEQIAKNYVVNNWVEELVNNAKVEFPKDSTLSYYNPIVAKVENKAIYLADLAANIYSNPQIGQFLSQGGANVDSLITIFRKQAFDNLIEQKVAALSAKKDKIAVIGDDREVLADMQKYVTRDLKASDAEIQKYYDDKKRELYLIPGSANVSQISFNTKTQAQAFQQAIFSSKGQDLVWLAAQNNGTVNDLGKIGSAGTADPLLSKEIFEKNKMVTIGSGRLTDVVESGGKVLMAYVTNLVPDSFKPIEEVRQDVADKAIQDKKTAEGRKWIEAERKKYKVEDNLNKVLAELKTRSDKAAAAAKAEEAKKKAEEQKNSSNQQNKTETTPKDSTSKP